VLVVQGGGSMRCALLGDQLAAMAVDNGWAGIIVNGCIRDSADIGAMPLGVKALATFPLKSSKRDPGLRDVPVLVAGVLVNPGACVWVPLLRERHTPDDDRLCLRCSWQRDRSQLRRVLLSPPLSRAEPRNLAAGWWARGDR
jgi:hypothetical protein